MVRLLIHVEGETEESFVNEALARRLYAKGYQKVSARLVGNARLRDRRGGIRPWPSVSADIINHLKEDDGCLATTMIDYYGLPATGVGAWPGRSAAAQKPFEEKAETVHAALAADIGARMGDSFDKGRFIPFVMMHEFEGLLFSDCRAFSDGIGRPELQERFQAIRDAFRNPEEINDSPETAPSKRILEIVPTYQKVLLGNIAILQIGLDTVCAECPTFCAWVQSLEEWVA
jgi:Domain of unknown function (DUF4276)